ncbi:MAG: rhodanese-like domain-containing protein [Segetibacter sp.]|jgi:rhodanese-related sulfurtransferase|nr:rhodanese-like domain-containing protein [Segetibacter sp.]
MKILTILKTFIVVVLMFASQALKAQNPVNWTKEQLMQPAQLAQTLQNKKPLPVIYSVGPGAVIPHSVDIGSVKEKQNLIEFKNQLSKLPKDAAIVVYCGCCPFDPCPNVRPAVAALKEMKFTNYKLLNLEHNIKTDWLDKGFPSAQ